MWQLNIHWMCNISHEICAWICCALFYYDYDCLIIFNPRPSSGQRVMFCSTLPVCLILLMLYRPQYFMKLIHISHTPCPYYEPETYAWVMTILAHFLLLWFFSRVHAIFNDINNAYTTIFHRADIYVIHILSSDLHWHEPEQSWLWLGCANFSGT